MINNDVVGNAGGITVVRARRTTDQTGVPNSSLTTLVFNVEDFDAESAWNGTTYTTPQAGFYEFLVAFRLQATGATAACDLQLILRIGTVTHGIQRILTPSAVGTWFMSGFYYASIAKGVAVQFQILPSFPGATAIKIDAALTPTALIIRRH
ncbi:hypothetical protein NDI44_08640 [Trichocoleus sp. DQ-A3]|uniref:hypothetical protein n=1 Tax=Cyanophyceae TaxID=3028117 RepID=UPI00168930F6|nr:hypothetical protein [Coleofasciculus sp. FACHB-125]MBD1899258.1 hypothetical protein [Coleofasciculus sp. FACHB-125]